MFRKIAAAFMASGAALVMAAAVPGTASAEPSQYCTSTAQVNIPKFQLTPTGVVLVGYYRSSFVASSPGLLYSFKIWHTNFDPNGAGPTVYSGAFAARCASDGTQNGTTDLTKEESETITSVTDALCHNNNFTVGSTSYTHRGLRVIGGRWFHYWGTQTSSAPLIGFSVKSARCSFAP
jgi:hypothetical protein